MRKLLLLLLVLAFFLAGPVHGQRATNGAVPSVIQNDLAAAFPKVTDFEWERDGSLFKVEFETEADVDHEIWYDRQGSIVRKVVEIPTEDIPDAVLRTLAADFAGYAIDDAERVTTPDGETFRMELESLLKEDWEVAFTADGRLLSKVED